MGGGTSSSCRDAILAAVAQSLGNVIPPDRLPTARWVVVGWSENGIKWVGQMGTVGGRGLEVRCNGRRWGWGMVVQGCGGTGR